MLISHLEGLILDFDGVFTNNQLSTNSNNEEAIISSKDDSIALKALFNMIKGMNLDFKVLVISGEKNNSIINRCNKLNLNCLNGIEEKLETAKKQFKDLEKVLYIGNDVNDFSTMAACGLRWCPNDANAPLDNNGVPLTFLNVGTGSDISIKNLSQLIADLTGFKGEILWDKSKPDGTPQKLLNISKIKSIGWSPAIKLEDGLKETISDFKSH